MSTIIETSPTPQISVNLPDSIRPVITESNRLIFARTELGIYGERLLLRVIEAIQFIIDKLSLLDGQDLRKIDIKKETILSGIFSVNMSLRSLTNKTHDTTDVRNYLRNLEKSDITIYDNFWGKLKIPFLSNVSIPERQNVLTVNVAPEMLCLLLDFSEGFTTYSLTDALSIRTPFGLKLYKILSGQKKSLTYSIAYLQERFNLDEKYHETTDIIRYVIIPAKREFDSKLSFTFDWEKVFTKKPGRKSEISAITFIPKKK